MFFWLFTVSVLATIIAVPGVIVSLPADYFHSGTPVRPAFSEHPAPVRILLIDGKNLLGLALVAVGIVFLVLPGQGVIVILIGVLLLDFPRKKRFERWLISRGPILKLSNWLRAKWGEQPLQLE